MDEHVNRTEISNAICELNRLSRCHEGIPEIRSEAPSTRSAYTSHIYPYSATKLQMNLNPRYISKISNSPRKIQDTSLRMRPYFVPERSRTKSENADQSDAHTYGDMVSGGGSNGAHSSIANSNIIMMDTSGDLGHGLSGDTFVSSSGVASSSTSSLKTKKFTLKKKSKSLEDVRAENLDGSGPSHEMEFVSSRIQKLKVQD